jgi:hypothetical protein
LAKKKNASALVDYTIPKQRGCYSCPRWDAFVKQIWESEKEICPEDNCFILQERAKTDQSQDQDNLDLPLSE